MAVKVLVTFIGQQLIADVSQVENTESKEVVGYWVKNPRVVNYTRDEETDNVGVNFGPYCLVTSENEFALRAEYVVSILEPTTEVAEGYTKAVYSDNPPATEPTEAEAFAQEAVEPKAQEGITPAPETTETPVNDANNTPPVEGPDNAGSPDGTTGDGTQVPPA